MSPAPNPSNREQGNPMTLALYNGESAWRNPVEHLCDELMCHIFECHSCINGLEDSCQTFRALKQEIAANGGPVRGVALTM